VRQKQLYQKQLQSLLSANEQRRDKLRLQLESELSKDLTRAPTTEENLKWQLREKDNQIMRLEAECSKLEQRTLDDGRKLTIDPTSQETDAQSAQRKVNELQNRLKMVETRLAEKEKEDILRQLQEQKCNARFFKSAFSIK
jgi:angiomotin like